MKSPGRIFVFVTLSLLMAFVVLSSHAGAANEPSWPQWRGPNRDGISTDTTPIAESFPETGLKKLWESDYIPSDHVGGHGSPVVAGEPGVHFRGLA